MKIESKRLILRDWQDKDVNDLVEGLNNIEVSKWMAGVPFPYTENDAKNFINWAKNQNEKYQKNGYGTEAFSARIKYCFEELGLRRIENGYFSGNNKSRKMQERLGYKKEGIRRKKFLCLATNEYVDECITGLLKDEFVEWSDNNE